MTEITTPAATTPLKKYSELPAGEKAKIFWSKSKHKNSENMDEVAATNAARAEYGVEPLTEEEIQKMAEPGLVTKIVDNKVMVALGISGFLHSKFDYLKSTAKEKAAAKLGLQPTETAAAPTEATPTPVAPPAPVVAAAEPAPAPVAVPAPTPVATTPTPAAPVVASPAPAVAAATPSSAPVAPVAAPASAEVAPAAAPETKPATILPQPAEVKSFFTNNLVGEKLGLAQTEPTAAVPTVIAPAASPAVVAAEPTSAPASAASTETTPA